MYSGAEEGAQNTSWLKPFIMSRDLVGIIYYILNVNKYGFMV